MFSSVTICAGGRETHQCLSFQITRPLNDSFCNNLNHCSLGSAITWVLMTSKIPLSPAAKEHALCLHNPQRELRMCPLEPQATSDILDNYIQARKKWPSNICKWVCTTSVAEPLVFHAHCCGLRSSVLHPLLLKLLLRAAKQTCSSAPPCDPSPVREHFSKGSVKPGSTRAGWAHSGCAHPACRVWTAGWCVRMSQLQSPSAEQTSIVSSLERTRLPLWRH